MPRLIMIDGAQTGASFTLGVHNFLGLEQGRLAIAPAHNSPHQFCYIGAKNREHYELRNNAAPQQVKVNGEGVRQAWLKHGDLIVIGTPYRDLVMIYDMDDQDSSEHARPGGMGAIGGVPRPAAQAGMAPQFGGITAHDAPEELMGTVSIRREDLAEQANINHRQKAYENDEAVLKAIQDGRRIKILYQVSTKIGSTLDPEAMLNDLLGLVLEELKADRGSVLLFDLQTRRLRTVASRSRHGGSARVRISRTIVREVLKTRESLLTTDAQADRRLDMATSIVDENIRSALCVPLVRKDTILGIIFLDTFDHARQFDEGDCDLLTAIAMQASMALENMRLVQEMSDRERMKHELNLASMIQKQLLPKKLPRSRQIEVYGKMIPAKEMSGDYFDFMDHEENGDFHICIGDVSGKGLPAGLVMIMARCYLRPFTKQIVSPAEILGEANRLLYNDTRRDVFMSALLLHWSDRTGKFVWSGAGHEHLIVYRARTRTIETIKAGGVVLAAVRDASSLYQDHELHLEPGDSLVLYTDGVTEAMNPQGDFFAADSLQPVERLVELYGHLSAQQLLEAVLWSLKEFINGADQADDITVVTVKRTGQAVG